MKGIVKTQYIFTFAEILVAFLAICFANWKKQRAFGCLLFAIFVIIANQFITLWKKSYSLYQMHQSTTKNSTSNNLHAASDAEYLYFIIALNFWWFLLLSVISSFSCFLSCIGLCYMTLIG